MRAVNLLPADLRGASKTSTELSAAPESTGGAGPFVVLGVLAACVAAIAGYVLTQNTIKQRTADLAEVTTRQQALSATAAKLKPYADFDAMSKARVQTVKDLASSRFDWEQALNGLSRAIPPDVTLKSLSGNINADSGSGGGSSSLRGAIAAPAITVTGCAPGQSEVARLMARLRDVDGVTRVTLSKSDVAKTESGSTGGSALEQRAAAPCGVGSHPEFEVVLFFETAPAAVSAPSNPSDSSSGAAVATPTPTATPAGGTAASATPAAGGTTP